MPGPKLPTAPEEGSADGIAYGLWPGADPSFVLIHGISANHRSFLELAGHLAGHRVVAYDLRGRGASTQEGPFGLAAHAQDARRLADALGLERPILVGHSLGAYAAARAVADEPGRFSGLALLDGGIWPPWVVSEEVLRVVLKTAVDRLGLTFPSHEAYADYWASSELRLAMTPARRSSLARDLVATADGYRPATRAETFWEDSRAVGADPEKNALFTRIEVPTLLVRAPNGLNGDPMTALVSDYVLGEARPLVGGIEVLDLDDANHYDMLEGRHAERIGEALKRFAAAQDSAAAGSSDTIGSPRAGA